MCISNQNIDPTQLAALKEFAANLEGLDIPTTEEEKTNFSQEEWSPLKTLLNMIVGSIEEGTEFHLMPMQPELTEEEQQMLAAQAAAIQAQQQAAIAQGQVPPGIYPPNGAQPDVDNRPMPGNYL
jgi:hypothetical protein